MRIEALKKKLVIPEDVFDGFLSAQGWSWHELARGDLPMSFEDIQLGLICRDHVLWARAFLCEPDTRDPYEYWDYQLASALDEGDVIHADGAEVGKTREIGNKILHRAFTVEGSSILVGAPEQVHLDEIIDYCNDQMFDLSPELGRGLKRHKKHPHHVFYFKNRARIYFSPAGFEGTGFRGKHVSDYAIMDEAAKIKNPDIWNEFFRSAKPNCSIRIYSVPDGDRATTFYRLKEQARGNAKKEDNEISNLVGGRNFTFYQWRKTAQPFPFWSKERRRFYIDLYGGEESAGYKRNILGEDGDPENPVFPYLQFERCLKHMPEYFVLKVLVDNGSVSLTGSRYNVTMGANGRRAGSEVIITESSSRASDFDLAATLKTFFSSFHGLLYMGCDLGFSNDPTEMVVRLVYGKVWRTVARLQLKGVSYDLQANAIDAMDDVFSPKAIGVDFGNAGSAVVHILQNPDHYEGKNYTERVRGWQFAEAVDDMDEDGEVIIDKKTDKPRRKAVKQLATEILVRKMQRCEWEVPFDRDYLDQFPSHTYRVGSRHLIYSKGNDHIIDAERVATLAQVIPFATAPDLFSSGINIRQGAA